MCEGDHLGRPISQRKIYTYMLFGCIASFSNLNCPKQPRLLEKITFILKFKPWEAGLEQGQFAEKGQRQRFLFKS